MAFGERVSSWRLHACKWALAMQLCIAMMRCLSYRPQFILVIACCDLVEGLHGLHVSSVARGNEDTARCDPQCPILDGVTPHTEKA